MKKVYVFACVLLLTAAVVAESPQSEKNKVAAPSSIIVVKLNGLNCTTTAGTNMFDVFAWSWGASNPATIGAGGGGIGAGKASISSLNVLKNFDACSPILFNAVTLGKVFAGLTLTQADSHGNVLLTVTLTNTLVESWQVSGSTGSEFPTESVSFAFEKVCVADASTSTKACFDSTKGIAF